MTINEKQFNFTRMLGNLIRYAEIQGIIITIREVQRFPERQQQLVEQGLSQTHHSNHLLSLAADIIVFENGEPVWDAKHPDYLDLAEHWESLGGVWGGRWSFRDAIHFEYE